MPSNKLTKIAKKPSEGSRLQQHSETSTAEHPATVDLVNRGQKYPANAGRHATELGSGLLAIRTLRL